ncbi:glycosyltransferase family 20 protein [Sphaerobolus stellatus SS14]|nr:glycosyltransferase family 20 protein [Sphaerobolus stellatus SS14]
MSTLREHRVIIATLFLPTTAVLENANSSPFDEHTIDYISEEPEGISPREIVINTIPPTPAPGSIGSNSPLRSIVEDLTTRSKATTPAVTTPYLDQRQNPIAAHFQSLGGALSALKAKGDSLFHLAQPPPGKHPAPTSAPVQIPTRKDSKSTPSKSLHQHEAPARHTSKTRRSSSIRRPQSHSPGRSNGVQSPEEQRWHFEPNPQGNGGLYNAVASVESTFLRRKLWVGTLGTATDGFDTGVRRQMDRRLREDANSVSIWLDDSEFSGFYDTFCHQVLWPALHYAVPDAPRTKVFYESSTYQQYVAANRKFADTIIKEYEEGDIVWVNDYHLLLVPEMVRAALPNAIIGLFLHVAFPSSEIFRCMAVREQLLHGMLGADLIGFQTANFARHFRQTVSRILSLEAVPKGITTKEGRFVDVGVFPMGIDVKALTAKRKDPEVKEWEVVLRQRYANNLLLVGRDKLDSIQGVRKKLEAFEAFLIKYPEMIGKAVLLQVALSTTEDDDTMGGVSGVVARINSKWSEVTAGYQPVVFLHTLDLTFSQYLALLTVADAFIVTSLREGMALRTHEFVECQESRNRPLILSEFTGSYSYAGFRSCIPINPWDANGTAEAIHHALTMPEEEVKMRWKDLHAHVITQTAQKFVTTFLTRCIRVNLEHAQRDPESIPDMDVDAVMGKYKYSAERLILLDLEDTLWVREHPQHSFEPPEETVEILRKLAQDRKNQVWVLSGLPRMALDKMSSLVPEVGLVAENGCFIKPRPVRGKQQEWVNMVANYNMTWKTPCLEILGYFTERTPGSFVVPREASIVWHFTSNDEKNTSGEKAWARRQAAEAQNHIWDSLGERYGLRIIPRPSSFIVLPSNVSRSSAVGAIMRPNGPGSSMQNDNEGNEPLENIDLVLCIGSDEKLLSRLNELHNAETVTTSGKGSDARWRLDVGDVVGMLWRFVRGQ